MAKKINKLLNIFKRFNIDSINLTTESAGITISYTNWDKEAAWLMYIELLTRVATQPLNNTGDELSALNSIYKIFEVTREILKSYGRNAVNFTKISIIILNQKIRPFTSKWHKLSIENAFEDDNQCDIFRQELEQLRNVLICYTKLLADMANVEDLTVFN